MKIKKICLLLLSLGFVHQLSAQSNILNATTAQDIGKKTRETILSDNDEPLPYGYINDRDILWSKVVWEYIDLNQKINLPFYFPVDEGSVGLNRLSLFDTLLKGIRSGKIKDVYADSFFTTKVTEKDINEKLINVRQSGNYRDTFRIQSRDIEAYMIKGLWYFDKRQGELKYRLLAIAPMGKDVLTIGVQDIQDDQLYELFWVFYPSARKVLHDAKVFNPQNVANPISFDHLLNARRFNTVVVREENVYGNRKISDYIRGNSLYQLLEADRIKESIRNKEMDMWNY